MQFFLPGLMTDNADIFLLLRSLFLNMMFFKQKTAYEILSGLVGSEMCIRDRHFTNLSIVDFKRSNLCFGNLAYLSDVQIWTQ